ncbi:MAG: class I SAM-dependent RNA methyltransferase [Armatimonadota bacterium]
MNKLTLIATAAFGLETLVKQELTNLGFENIKTFDGRIEFEADFSDIPKANLWLRCADRVLLKMGEFKSTTFDELFEGTKAIPWEKLIPEDGKFTVLAKSVKSALSSTPACQSIVKKAVVERLKEKYNTEWFKETGAEFTIQASLLKDTAILTIDTSGDALHKRGYRKKTVEAPIKETLAAALVLLSFWNKDRLLIDPMCGSGTIPIEAAMIARNIAPGLKRNFASESWNIIDKKTWKNERESAKNSIDPTGKLQIFGYDINQENIKGCRTNAFSAGVEKDIVFAQKDIKDLWIDKQYGVIISNPPYGERISDYSEINKINISLHKTFKKKKGWSVYILTADEMFPNYFKRSKPDRVRKLYNGKIKVNYYQYYGEKPKE